MNENEIKAIATAIINHYKDDLKALDNFIADFADNDAEWTNSPLVKRIVRDVAQAAYELFPPRLEFSDDELTALIQRAKYQ